MNSGGRLEPGSLAAEHHRVHDASGPKGEKSGDHQRAHEETLHGSPVPADLMRVA